MALNRPARIILTILVVAAAATFGTSSRFYQEALGNIFFGIALLSASIIQLRIFPRLLDALAVIAGTALLAAVDFSILHFTPRLAAGFSFFGLASLAVLAVRLIWSEQQNRKLAALAFFPTLLFVSSEWFASTMLDWTEKLHPGALDLYLYSFDASLRVQPAILLGQAFSTWPLLRAISLIFYIALPIPIAVVYSGWLLRRQERALPAMLGFLVTGPLGILFYNLFPALGPVHLLGAAFPWHSLGIDEVRRVRLESLPLHGPRNAIPSLHMGWVLLAWWYARGLSLWERSVIFLFLAFTVCATMGSGEHYFVDLVVAFPFALLIQGLCAWPVAWNNPARSTALLFGALATLGWLAALRLMTGFFWTSPVTPWVLCVGTIALTIVYQRRLELAASASVVVAPEPEPAVVQAS